MASLSRPLTSAAEAEQFAVTAIQNHYGPPTDAGFYEIVLNPAGTITLRHGWIVRIVVRVYDYDRQCFAPILGSGVRYVEAATGEIIWFSAVANLALQEAVHRSVQGYEPALPWPRLTGVRVADGDHLVANLMPAETLCGHPLTGTEPSIAYGKVDVTECTACWLGINGVGVCCFHCGRRLQHATPPWYCTSCPQPPAANDE